MRERERERDREREREGERERESGIQGELQHLSHRSNTWRHA